MLENLKTLIFCLIEAGNSAGAGAGVVCSLGFQNQWVHIVLEASKSAVAKGDVQRSADLCTRCTRANPFPEGQNYYNSNIFPKNGKEPYFF